MLLKIDDKLLVQIHFFETHRRFPGRTQKNWFLLDITDNRVFNVLELAAVDRCGNRIERDSFGIGEFMSQVVPSIGSNQLGLVRIAAKLWFFRAESIVVFGEHVNARTQNPQERKERTSEAWQLGWTVNRRFPVFVQRNFPSSEGILPSWSSHLFTAPRAHRQQYSRPGWTEIV